MSEIINTYHHDDPYTVIPMDRDAFYEEQIAVFKKTGKPTRSNETIAIFLFNPDGEILLQKRSYDKAHNPGLLDKSIGGHMRTGDSADYTVMVETVQELQTPSIVLRSEEDFQKTIKLLGSYLGTIAVVKHVETRDFQFEKIIKDESVRIANKTHLYLGMYDGRIRPVDREAKGVLWYSLDELQRELDSTPSVFTNDLHELFKEYRDVMEAFIESCVKKD